MGSIDKNTPGCAAGFVWQEMWDKADRETYLMLGAEFTPFGHLTHTHKYTLTVYAQNTDGVMRPTQTIDLDAADLHTAGIAACVYVSLWHPHYKGAKHGSTN